VYSEPIAELLSEQVLVMMSRLSDVSGLCSTAVFAHCDHT
jgi:hypothetical protein